jgi:predicted dehydrogenase
VWARRPDAAEKLASKHGAIAAPSFEALLAACDAVAFAVPPDVQASMAVDAAKAGKALLLEKPIALDTDAAQRLVDAVDDAGVRTVVLLSWRYAQAVDDFLAEAAALGPLLGGRAAFISGALLGGPFATPWRLERGPLLDLGPHVVDLVDAALGPVVDVRASGDPLGYVSLALRHESGASSSIGLCANSAVEPHVAEVAVYSASGGAYINTAVVGDAASMGNVAKALAAAARGEPTNAPDVHRGLYLQRILNDAEAQLR